LHSHPAAALARFNPIAIATMSCRDFERMIGETFQRRGFHVAGFGMRAAAGGADLALLKSGERFLVHCQHWRKQEIGVLAVRGLNTALQAVGAQGGYMLTAGGFTREACEFAGSTRIELIDGENLIAWLRGAKRGLDEARKGMISNRLRSQGGYAAAGVVNRPRR
jgi:restriction system protein